MQQYIIQRLLLNIPVIFLVITLVFLATRIQPDFAERRAAQGATGFGSYDLAVKQIRKQLGTDKPLPEQYVRYVGGVLRGDFGDSLLTKKPVLTELKNRLGPSIELGILQMIVAVAISVPIGVISAVRQDTWLDYLLRFFAVLGLAIPSFYLATLMLIFAFNWFNWAPPITGFKSFFNDPVLNLKAMAIPALAGGFASSAIIMRLLRSQLLEVLRQDYVRTAWAKGLKERTIIVRHALKNAMIPVFTVVGLLIATLFGGNVVLESMFTIPGVGLLVVTAFQQADFPVVQSIVLVIALALVFTNLVVDLSYAWLDPRIRYG